MSEAESGADNQRSTLRDQQKQRTRRKLLEAARRRFVDRGFAEVTIDITGEVGCSRATFYLHFAGKSDVLRKMSAETARERAVEIYADLDEVLEARSRTEFVRWMRRAVAWFEANQDVLPARDELLVSQLERFFTRWAVQGTIRASGDEAADVLCDIWFPALLPPD